MHTTQSIYTREQVALGRAADDAVDDRRVVVPPQIDALAEREDRGVRISCVPYGDILLQNTSGGLGKHGDDNEDVQYRASREQEHQRRSQQQQRRWW